MVSYYYYTTRSTSPFYFSSLRSSIFKLSFLSSRARHTAAMKEGGNCVHYTTHAGIKGAEHIEIPAVIVHNGPVTDSIKTHGGNDLISNQRKSIYHVQGTPSSLRTLNGVNISEASVILVACGDNSSDDEDTFVLLIF